MKTLTILGRRWFRRSAGNTYHTATIMVDGKTVHTTPMQYGYGSAYLQTATDWLIENGYLPEYDRRKNVIWSYCEDRGIACEYSATDVARQKDL